MTAFLLANANGHMNKQYTAEIITDIQDGGRVIGKVSVLDHGKRLVAQIDNAGPLPIRRRRIDITAPAGRQFGHDDVYGAIAEMLAGDGTGTPLIAGLLN